MNILVSGLVNTETTAQVRGFPIPYYSIDYPFFGVNTAVSGVGFNLAKAMKTLGDQVCLRSMTGDDFSASFIRHTLQCVGIDSSGVLPRLRQTASSVVLYDPEGKRQIYCDLKDIQETAYPFSPADLDGIDLVVACNINYNRPLLHLARAAGKTIATDVHVLSNIYDDYSREFMDAADILFLSDEAIGEYYADFIQALAATSQQNHRAGPGKQGRSHLSACRRQHHRVASCLCRASRQHRWSRRCSIQRFSAFLCQGLCAPGCTAPGAGLRRPQNHDQWCIQRFYFRRCCRRLYFPRKRCAHH